MTSYFAVTRNQFTFSVNDATLRCILTRAVAPPLGGIAVNVVAIMQVKIPGGSPTCNLVKIVVGTDNPNDPTLGGDTSVGDVLGHNPQQNDRFRQILQTLGVIYSEQEVTQVFNVEPTTGTPGRYRRIFSLITCAGISPVASYIGEPEDTQVVSLIIEPPAGQAIVTTNLINSTSENPFNEAALCVNTSNVNAACPAGSAGNCGLLLPQTPCLVIQPCSVPCSSPCTTPCAQPCKPKCKPCGF